jgi:phospholipid/cholesterol/gamma-HCH transport system substrate-binding protein
VTRGVKIRLMAFIVLSAVGIVYVAASYLGVVDKVLGRGFTVHATLPTSGGLFVGSEVDYRGVKIGRVSAMTATADGVRLDLALQQDVQLPLDSPFYVHNLSAVGEQYVDFEPPDTDGPYATSGSDFTGSQASLPVDEGDLLVSLNKLVTSVDKNKLSDLVKELGLMFDDTAKPLQQLIDGGGQFIRTASAHTPQTVRLLDNALTVLGTQQAEGDNITNFAHQLRLLTDTLRGSDGDLRQVLDDTPGTATEVQKLLRGLQPTLPALLSDLVNINSVVVSHLAGTEQLLVTFPRVIAGGFTGSPPDGYGHVNLQFDYSVPPCTKGYKPRSQWRQGNVLTDSPIYPAHCDSGPPYVMRGANHVPGTPGNPSPGRDYTGSYDPRSGVVAGVTDAHGRPVRFVDPGDLSIMGDDAWKWLLVGPVATR